MIRVAILALALALSTSACGDDGGSSIDCAESTLTFANFGEPFIIANCRTCHSEDPGTDRRGAPSSVNWDTLEQVQSLSDRMLARAGNGTSMPPSTAPAFPSDADRALLAEWLSCGPN